MRQHRALPRQMESLVNGKIVPRPGKQAADLLDLASIFVDVSLKKHAWMFGHQRLADLEHGL